MIITLIPFPMLLNLNETFDSFLFKHLFNLRKFDKNTFIPVILVSLTLIKFEVQIAIILSGRGT